MKREQRFFSIISAIWGIEKSLKENGECFVCYKNFEFEFDKVSDWSWFRTMYDGQFYLQPSYLEVADILGWLL